jgi:SET domain-containing protein
MDSDNFLEKFVFVGSSPIEGKGIFTSKKIKEGESILVIKGEVITEEECIRREEEEGNVYIFWNEDNYIDVANTEKIKYINHNCNCNCCVEAYDDDSLLLVADRNIDPDEELTIDYGYDEIYETCNCEICNPR